MGAKPHFAAQPVQSKALHKTLRQSAFSKAQDSYLV